MKEVVQNQRARIALNQNIKACYFSLVLSPHPVCYQVRNEAMKENKNSYCFLKI